MALIRSFVAVDLSSDLKKTIKEWVNPFRVHDSSIRWIDPEKIHLTLQFLGDVEEKRFEEEFFPKFPQLLTPFHPITLLVRGKGEFPPKGIPRVLWLGLEGDLDKLKELVGTIGLFFEGFGFQRETKPHGGKPHGDRPFSPHLTLARLRQKPSSGFLKKWRGINEVNLGGLTVDHLVFYRSLLTKGGAVYRVIRRFVMGQVFLGGLFF